MVERVRTYLVVRVRSRLHFSPGQHVLPNRTVITSAARIQPYNPRAHLANRGPDRIAIANLHVRQPRQAHFLLVILQCGGRKAARLQQRHDDVARSLIDTRACEPWRWRKQRVIQIDGGNLRSVTRHRAPRAPLLPRRGERRTKRGERSLPSRLQARHSISRRNQVGRRRVGEIDCIGCIGVREHVERPATIVRAQPGLVVALPKFCDFGMHEKPSL
mmetsp:Transcript_7917/g.26186  ORF Transcript_7917/g.26186 Transcript_7917/m.26186 type:complete len:217 (+) Transcript_7917:201-851(+)